MSTALARDAFMPPPTPGLGRAVTMALFAHALLVLALSFGVQWRQSAPEPVTFAAELWAQVPTEAAPPAPEPVPVVTEVETPIEPPPTPAPLPPPVLKPAPPPPAAEQPPKAVDIVLEKKKALQEAKKKQELEQAKAKAAQEKDKAAKLKEDKQKEDKQKAEKRLKEEKAAEAQRKKEAQQAAEEAKQSEQRHKENKERALRLAGAALGNGDDNSKGNAAKGSGPSAKYGSKIATLIKDNIVETNGMVGNPSVEYDVYSDASGNIVSAKLRKKSGDPYWDEAALKGILKTAKLPRDEDGRVPSPMTIVLEPKPR